MYLTLFVDHSLYRNLRRSDAGQMIIIISIALLLQQTFNNNIFFEPIYPGPLCFVTRLFTFYFAIVYLLLLAAESVNLFVKVGLVFASIDHFPLKASLIAFSKSIVKSITQLHCYNNYLSYLK